jgi:flagellar biosynthetic protein FliR
MTLLLVGLSFPVLPDAVDRLVDLATQAMSTMSGGG